MTACERIAAKALSLVGQGYIYGAKGQVCSPAFRQQQARQYPEQADRILLNGRKWDGIAVWDCAQLTRAAAKEAGFSLASGATSQWNKTSWRCKGTLDTLPADAVAFVYRRANGRMQHTGVALGDGTCVHARGTDYGVIRQKLDEYAWTHWAALWSVAHREPEMSGIAEVWAQSGSTVHVRCEPGGKIIGRLPIGTVVEIGAQSAGWTAVSYQGAVGYMQSAFLRDATRREQSLIDRIKALEERLAKAGL